MGEYFADYDSDTGCWGVFHTDQDSGHCWALFSTQEEAEQYAEELNDVRLQIDTGVDTHPY